jgi:hypothetical protein
MCGGNGSGVNHAIHTHARMKADVIRHKDMINTLVANTID